MFVLSKQLVRKLLVCPFVFVAFGFPLRSAGHSIPSDKGTNEDKCVECHADRTKVPAKGSRHAALDAGCDTCHVSHKTGEIANTQPGPYLVKAPPQLCLDCHDAQQKELVDAHQGQPFATSDCTGCHDPHESESPKLLNKYVHFPFGEKMCDACHQAPKNGKVVLIADGKFKLCYTCHDARQKQVESSKNPHPAFQVIDGCTECHNPHASRFPKMLKQSQRQVCASCHERSNEKVLHGPYKAGQCAKCHDPHGTELPSLLRAQTNDLCKGCHVAPQADAIKRDAGRVMLPWGQTLNAAEYDAAPKLPLDASGERGHPIAGHPFSGNNTKGRGKDKDAPLTCLNCHHQHSSELPRLMQRGVKRPLELCAKCHDV